MKPGLSELMLSACGNSEMKHNVRVIVFKQGRI